MSLRKVPDPVLRKKAVVVDGMRDVERSMLSEMAQVMYLNGGVGLAATQVGIDKQLAVVDVGEGLVKLANPQIVKKEGEAVEEEGCLSVPNVLVKVKRAKKITLSFLNENGEASQLSADGLFARAIQHEIDHLSGRIIVDYLNPVERLFASYRRKKT